MLYVKHNEYLATCKRMEIVMGKVDVEWYSMICDCVSDTHCEWIVYVDCDCECVCGCEGIERGDAPHVLGSEKRPRMFMWP